MTQGQRKTSDCKLVPFEPTPEMIEAAEEAHMPFGDMDLALRMAILAAPAVQGELVGWQFYQDGKWWNGDDRIKDHRKNTEEAGYPVRDVYAARSPRRTLRGWWMRWRQHWAALTTGVRGKTPAI